MARPIRTISNPDPSDRPERRQNTGESLESGEIPPTTSTNVAGGRETQFSDNLNNTLKHKDLEDSAFSPNREGGFSTKQPTGSETSRGSAAIDALEEQRLKIKANIKKLHDDFMQNLAEIRRKKEDYLRAEDERIQREEEERKRKEEEERIRAEEERKRKEEEERVRAEAEERKKREEEERKKEKEKRRKIRRREKKRKQQKERRSRRKRKKRQRNGLTSCKVLKTYSRGL